MPGILYFFERFLLCVDLRGPHGEFLFFVHPDLQRRGIRRQMLERINSWMDDDISPLADEPGF
jgi:GNAT superfamily N-acetyltransferase